MYMESSTKDGYKCRCAFTDFTQHASLVSRGAYSKVLSTQPTPTFQQDLAQKVNTLPMTSIIGSIITRSGGVNLEAFSDKLSKSFGRPRSMFVPVAMPPAFLKHIKSASRRALGPNIDTQERSGIEFSMRMIGARVSDVAAATSSGDVLEVDEEDDVEEEEELEE